MGTADYEKMKRKKESDRSLLVEAVRANKRNNVLAQYRNTQTDIPVVPNINSLIAALEKAQDDPSEPAYSSKTCVEFHHFFVDTLIGYLRALLKLHKAGRRDGTTTCNYKPGSETVVESNLKAEWKEVYQYTDLLWRISTSRMFDYHAEVLGRFSHLTLRPAMDYEVACIWFSPREPVSRKSGANGDDVKGDNEIEMDPAGNQAADIPSGNELREEIEKTASEGGGPMDILYGDSIEEEWEMNLTIRRQVVKSWSSLISSHLIALSILVCKAPKLDHSNSKPAPIHTLLSQ